MPRPGDAWARAQPDTMATVTPPSLPSRMTCPLWRPHLAVCMASGQGDLGVSHVRTYLTEHGAFRA